MEINYKHDIITHNKSAAKVILPIVLSSNKISSIVDVGCGIGTWVAVAKSLGINNILGIDGTHVDSNLLEINSDEFITHDLRNFLEIHKKYDLAICLEVAEHLPEESSDSLIKTLINLSNNILFSAALPGQGGQFHLNEQPFEYWQKKFFSYNYHFYDLIRPTIWDDERVEWWYRQNIFLIKKVEQKIDFDVIRTSYHPELYQKLLRRKNNFENKYKAILAGDIRLTEALNIILITIAKKIKNFFKIK